MIHVLENYNEKIPGG